MDKIEALGNTLSQITMYDIKSMYNQAKNVVLNVSETEAKVREATNDDPWGASSTLMQEIAQGTFNFQAFNEIMPCIYARFMEKEARQWRQIYKALQLLEYLIKHGSERVVDDARSHISTLKMLRNFHYIDEKGKDEGINVRNRSRELVELLSDVEKIRAERRKAKQNKNKYIGTGNDGFGGGMASFSSGGSRYGGFGSDSLGGGSSGGGGSYGREYGTYASGGGSSSGNNGGSFRDDRRGGGFEEYNAGDDEVASPSQSTSPPARMGSTRQPVRRATAPTPAPVPAPAPVEDLLGGFGDDDAFGNSTLATNKELPSVKKTTVAIDDDDFADFQAAPVQAAPTAAAKPNLMDILDSSSTSPRPTTNNVMGVQQPGAYGMNMGGMGMGMGMGGSHRPSPSLSSYSQFSSPISPQQTMQQQQQPFFGGAPLKPTSPMGSTFGSSAASRPSAQANAAKPATSSGGNFDDLWTMSLGGGSSGAVKPGVVGAGKSIKDLEREKAMAGLWGSGNPANGGTGAGNAFGGGQYGGFGAGTGSSSSGGDDLLL